MEPILKLQQGLLEFSNPYHDKRGRFSEALEGAKTPGGGATIEPGTGKSVETGYAVAVDNKYSSITPVAEFFSGEPPRGAKILADWLKKNKELFRDPNIKIGIWHDEEHHEIVLDPAEHVMDRTRALALGRSRDQQGIYGLGAKGEGYIETGGSGGR